MVSVIIPTYNNEDTIGRAIESVINQTFKDWEIVVIDDCSTDKTAEIVNKYVDDFDGNIRYVKNEENYGVGKTRKIGVDLAKGEFITFLDSDDYLLKEFIQMSMMLQRQHDSDVVYTNVILKYKEKVMPNNPPIPEHIMSGVISPSLHLNLNKKFFTGKTYRTSLLKSVEMSENRVAEDTQTLFFTCYEADKVRSSNYCGYVHDCRPNSLLGFETEDNIFGF